MDPAKTFKKLEQTLSIWESALNDYDMDVLLRKPSEESWSLGQVYVHLIQGTLNYHLKQVEKCLVSSEYADRKKNFKGVITYQILRSIPPIKVKVPPSDDYTPGQPSNKEEILEGLDQVRAEMAVWIDKLGQPGQGKRTHPAFSYLNGDEWYQLVEMHFRHHLRQKKRIDDYISGVL